MVATTIPVLVYWLLALQPKVVALDVVGRQHVNRKYDLKNNNDE